MYLGGGVNLTVANGGGCWPKARPPRRSALPALPGTSVNWGGITINGGAGSPETRIAYAHLEFNADDRHPFAPAAPCSWITSPSATPAHQYLSLDGSSFVVQDCVFPAHDRLVRAGPRHRRHQEPAGAASSCAISSGRSPATTTSIDFTGGHRPGPIVQFINNVFMGSGDDNLDLDNTDAWVEGNIFLHVHKNGSPDTSSAVSGGSDTGEPSEVTIIGNIFYDCDQAAMAKQGNFFTLINNTIVRQTHTGRAGHRGRGGLPGGQQHGRGGGRVSSRATSFTTSRSWCANRTNAVVTFTNNLMPLAWSGPGRATTRTSDPLLQLRAAVGETTNFTNWAQAQVMRSGSACGPVRPAIGTGPNGRDKGGVVPLGVSISGEPVESDQPDAAPR